MSIEADAPTIPAWTNEQIARGRALVALDTRARIELGDLLLEVAPWSEHEGGHQRTGTYALIDRFAKEIGLGSSSAHSYRKVAWRYGGTAKEAVEKSGLAISYTAIRNAVMDEEGSALLVRLVEAAVAAGKTRITADDVNAEQTARWHMEMAARRERATARRNAEEARLARLQEARDAGLAPWRDALDTLVEQSSDDAATVRDLAIEIFLAGGEPKDLITFGLVKTDDQRKVLDHFIDSAVDLRLVRNALNNAETSLRSLSGADLSGDTVPGRLREEWRSRADKLATLVMELGERLR
jgi:hypothetical protein